MARLVTVPTRLYVWLQRHSPLWPAGLGLLGGAGMGAVALWGLGGVIGAGVGLAVVGIVYWVAKDAEPVWLDEETWSRPETPSAPEPLPPSPLHEPLEMVVLPGGTFMMGAADVDTEAFDDERPQHAVTISALCMSRYPITRQLYRDVMGQGLLQWEGEPDDRQLPANRVD